jgi:predicted nucleotidyltransferase
VHRHYRGFALNQLRLLEKEPTAKKLLYVLRTTTTGIHLLETGELEADLTRLMGRYDLDDAMGLVERKRAGERVGLEPALLEVWRPRVDSLFTRLDAAREKSPLPEDPASEHELREWLLAVRCVFRSTWSPLPLRVGRPFRSTWALDRSAATSGWSG